MDLISGVFSNLGEGSFLKLAGRLALPLVGFAHGAAPLGHNTPAWLPQAPTQGLVLGASAFLSQLPHLPYPSPQAGSPRLSPCNSDALEHLCFLLRAAPQSSLFLLVTGAPATPHHPRGAGKGLIIIICKQLCTFTFVLHS